jgi:hypothetical protein
VPPPNLPPTRTKLYYPAARHDDGMHTALPSNSAHGQTPNSSHGGSTPANTPSHGLVGAKGALPHSAMAESRKDSKASHAKAARKSPLLQSKPGLP